MAKNLGYDPAPVPHVEQPALELYIIQELYRIAAVLNNLGERIAALEP